MKTAKKSRKQITRRTRRNQSEVIQRILESAREQFTKRGFADTTTKEIAKRADVSETLIFRYFANKQGLFDHIVYTPFIHLVDQVLTEMDEEHPGSQFEQRSHEALVRFLQRLSESRRLMSVLAVRGPPDITDPRIAEQMAEMRRNYDRSAKRLADAMELGKAGNYEGVPAGMIVRLLFGMIVA